MRKILIFSLCYYPRNVGGAEVAIKEITDRISPEEFEFDMITLRKQEAAFERIGNVNVHRVGLPWFGRNTRSSKISPLSKILYIPLAFLKALSLHRKHNYDMTWSMMASYAGFAALLFKWTKPQVPFLLSIQEGDNFERREGLFGGFFRLIFRAADRIQVISVFLADWSKKMGARCPISVVPNGVDFNLFSRPIDEHIAHELKSRFFKKEGDVFLVTTSRLVMKNAVDNIIRSLQYLPENMKLLVIGSGRDEEKLKKLCLNFRFPISNFQKMTNDKIFSNSSRLSLRETNVLKALRADGQMSNQSENPNSHQSSFINHKSSSRVFFLGFIPYVELPKYLQISDIFVRPSLSEGFGNSFIEAMAAGIPVIATPVGGIVDFLKNEETGLFCEVRNPESIAKQVKRLGEDHALRQKIIDNARKMVAEKYGW